MKDDKRLHAPAAERNRAPILEVLRAHLPAEGLVLEVASGTGQHVVHFAADLPHLVWQPSDPDPAQRASVAACVEEAGLTNVLPPLDFDVKGAWPVLKAAAVITANLLHVSGPETVPGLCRGAAVVLAPGGVLHVYGPFNRDGRYTSDGNARFDAALRQQNPTWGLRDLETVEQAALDAGLVLRRVIEMPANNLSVVFEKTV